MKDEPCPIPLPGNLKTRLMGRKVLYYPSLPSTMKVGREAAQQGAVEGTLVLAGQQTSGKGRLGRSWVSPPGNLSLSLVLRPTLRQLPRLTILAALAVAHAIERVTGLEPRLKWPNDVLLRGKKVCGILVESQTSGHSVAYAVVGVGLNVNLDPSAYPDIAEIATSLRAEAGRDVSPSQVLEAFLEETERLYLALQRGEPIHEEWRRRLETLGKEVRVTWGDEVEEGLAEGVDDDGNLLLRRPDGKLAVIAAGDVTLRS